MTEIDVQGGKNAKTDMTIKIEKGTRTDMAKSKAGKREEVRLVTTKKLGDDNNLLQTCLDITR